MVLENGIYNTLTHCIMDCWTWIILGRKHLNCSLAVALQRAFLSIAV